MLEGSKIVTRVSRNVYLVVLVLGALLVIVCGTWYMNYSNRSPYHLFVPMDKVHVHYAALSSGLQNLEYRRQNLTASINSTLWKNSSLYRSDVRGFILPVSVDQQLTGGLKGFMNLASFGAAFNLSTVEPFVWGSRLSGVPDSKYANVEREKEMLHLSDLYDGVALAEHFKQCSKEKNHVLSNFETFIRNASRAVILLIMVRTEPNLREIFKKYKNEKIVSLKSFNEYPQLNNRYKDLKMLNKWNTYILEKSKIISSRREEFIFTRIVVIDSHPMEPLKFSVIREKFGQILDEHIREYSSATVLVANWRAVTKDRAIASFYYFPGYPWGPCHYTDLIEHSLRVVNASREFARNLTSGVDHRRHRRRLLGVHIRGERVITEYKGNASHCLTALGSLLGQLNQAGNFTTIIIHDLTNVGTDSCYGNCAKKRKLFVRGINHLGYPVATFDPELYPSAVNNRGFASFVEKEYLANVDVLVTVGWGGFQHSLFQRFKHRHNRSDKDLHQICQSPNSL